MMRNTYRAKCEKCGQMVAPGDGFIDRRHGKHNGFRTIHGVCPAPVTHIDPPVLVPGQFATVDRQLPTEPKRRAIERLSWLRSVISATPLWGHSFAIDDAISLLRKREQTFPDYEKIIEWNSK
jgi:hypothetical protein